MSETFGWPERLDHRPHEAKAFYAAIAMATLAGLALNFVGIDEIKALYWSTVLNGVRAAPLMAVIMLVATNRRVMGQLTLPRSLAVVGWLATAVMAAATAGFFLL